MYQNYRKGSPSDARVRLIYGRLRKVPQTVVIHAVTDHFAGF